MVQLAGQDPVPASVPGEKNHFASGKPAREQIVRGLAERGFDFHPLLVRETFDAVKSGAADDADAML
jgi:uroporphyrinogen-III synthase